MLIELVVSGFQSGADIGGIKAAHDLGIKTGGHMTLGWKTEDGPRPEYADLYGAREFPSLEYPARTDANVHSSDATIWFGSEDSRGYWCTRKAAERHKRPFWEVGTPGGHTMPRDIVDLVLCLKPQVLNVSGNRASVAPDIEQRVYRFMTRVLMCLAKEAS